MKRKTILIVAYKFYPRGGVGTRRWSKLVKYLAKKYHVVVLSARYPLMDTVNWGVDVINNEHIEIIRTKGRYPHKLLSLLPKKIKIILSLLLKEATHYLDEAQLWKYKLAPSLREVLQRGDIKDIIVTGPSFSPMITVAKIKANFPDLNLILDYRDPWNYIDPRSDFGRIWRNFKKKRAHKYEDFVLSQASTVLFVTKSFKNAYSTYFPTYSSKFHTLYNGFDEEDFYAISKIKPDKDCLTIMYGGVLFEGRIKVFKAIVRALVELKDPFFINKLKIIIYTSEHDSSIKFQNEHQSNLFNKIFTLNPAISQKEFHTELSKCGMGLSINASYHSYAIGSKVFDYMGLNLPILNISNGGELHDRLIQHNQYSCDYQTEHLKKTFLKIKQDFLEDRLNKHQDYSKFNIKNLVAQFEQHLTKD